MQLFYCQELLFHCSNELKNVMPTTQNINFARSSIVDVQKWDSSLLVSEALPVGLNPGDEKRFSVGERESNRAKELS